MTNLTVWKFNTVDGAEKAIEKLTDLQKQHLIEIQDAAIVYWEPGRKKPKTRQALNTAAFGALDGAFWGMLFGLLFFVPIFGMAVGALSGALSGHFAAILRTDLGWDWRKAIHHLECRCKQNTVHGWIASRA